MVDKAGDWCTTECPQKLVTLLTCYYYAIFYIITITFYMKCCIGDYYSF